MGEACNSCGEQITWARHHESGNPMPLEEATEAQIEDGRGLWRIRTVKDIRTAYPAKPQEATGMFPVKLYVSHFATCPDADAWRGDDES